MSMTSSPSPQPTKIKLNYEDYLVLPDDGKRYEILSGELFVTPAPTTYHQSISKIIEFYLINCLEKSGAGQVFDAPIDVVFADDSIAQPDILFIRKERLEIIGESNIQGPPDLIIEILSPSTRRKDMRIKSALYAQFAVPHYWIADPDLECIELFQLEEQGYRLTDKFSKPDMLVFTAFPGLQIPLLEVFAPVR